MEEIRLGLGDRSYSIFIGSGMLGDLGRAVAGFGFSARMALVSNPTVYGLYGDTVKRSLEKEGFRVHDVIIPDGEQYKDFEWLYRVLTSLLEAGLDRRSAVVALGGGVIGDMAGFAAAVYMRGISCIQVPTTLLAQVDSSVGGKTGVNHPLGKNMIGSFHQPSLVWIDTDVLRTLPAREFRAGMAEVIKYGVIRDEEMFHRIGREINAVMGLDSTVLSYIIRRSCEIKADVVSEDEREAGLRAILNFGHTIGHAVETLTGYTEYLHGEAVAIGMCCEALLSEEAGIARQGTAGRIRSVVEAYGLPVDLPAGLEPGRIMDTMVIDKKAVEGRLTFVLPEEVGSVRILDDLPADIVLRTLGKHIPSA